LRGQQESFLKSLKIGGENNMKLDRNITNPKRGKYALIKLRIAQPEITATHVDKDGNVTPVGYEIPASAVDFGDTEDSDFFVLRLKDKYASAALYAYARAAHQDGQTEYAAEVQMLADDALCHPNKQTPS
jgi:hypothetical protein